MLSFVGEHSRSSRATVLCSGWGRVVSAPDQGPLVPIWPLSSQKASLAFLAVRHSPLASGSSSRRRGRWTYEEIV